MVSPRGNFGSVKNPDVLFGTHPDTSPTKKKTKKDLGINTLGILAGQIIPNTPNKKTILNTREQTAENNSVWKVPHEVTYPIKMYLRAIRDGKALPEPDLQNVLDQIINSRSKEELRRILEKQIDPNNPKPTNEMFVKIRVNLDSVPITPFTLTSELESVPAPGHTIEWINQRLAELEIEEKALLEQIAEETKES